MFRRTVECLQFLFGINGELNLIWAHTCTESKFCISIGRCLEPRLTYRCRKDVSSSLSNMFFIQKNVGISSVSTKHAASITTNIALNGAYMTATPFALFVLLIPALVFSAGCIECNRLNEWQHTATLNADNRCMVCRRFSSKAIKENVMSATHAFTVHLVTHDLILVYTFTMKKQCQRKRLLDFFHLLLRKQRKLVSSIWPSWVRCSHYDASPASSSSSKSIVT